MAMVISNTNQDDHNINRYSFKSLGSVSEPDLEIQEPLKVEPENRTREIDSSALSQSSKDSLIESLMKKTEDMSSNFIKLQMRLEDKESEYEVNLQKAKELSFQEGVAAGKQQALVEGTSNINSAVEQFSVSIATLEKSSQEFNQALDNIKGDLMLAALDIAKEVVSSEVSENSNRIANVLSQDLMRELQTASKITLRVNPLNHGAISERIGVLNHIEVISDSAVTAGGVIAISDAGNIDAQISKRFEKVRRAALSE
ncbi:MAG: flagellar assembly protein FliH [Campylobacterota bacterium]|nr:flagellar assembly protein FliH [Campylobacterota bacterium]